MITKYVLRHSTSSAGSRRVGVSYKWKHMGMNCPGKRVVRLTDRHCWHWCKTINQTNKTTNNSDADMRSYRKLILIFKGWRTQVAYYFCCVVAVCILCLFPTTSWVGLQSVIIENTRWVSFDIKFTSQGFENACWHCEACPAIQHAFSKPSLVNLILKDANLVFYLSVYPLLNTLQTSDYDVFFYFCVDSVSLATSFKKYNVIMTW